MADDTATVEQLRAELKQLRHLYAVAQTEIEAQRQSLAAADTREAALAEVLRVIATTPTDLPAVLQTLIENATRLCAADSGAVIMFDGQMLRPVHYHGGSAEMREYWQRNPISVNRRSITGRVALEWRTIHLADVLADPDYELREGQK
jgi:two-component system, NtrC family, sensor kinase